MAWLKTATAGLALSAGLAAPANSAPVLLDPATLLARSSLHGVIAEPGRLDGRAALNLRVRPGPVLADGDTYATLTGTDFHDGDIEADIAADVLPQSDPTIRAFVGLGFRAAAGGYEAFYLRMKNGRAEDQLQRNHAAQYISYPGYGWQKLRTTSPGVYESYVDLLPGRWTHLRISVHAGEARLFVNRNEQPTLIVHDLKRGASAHGNVMLWVGPGTAAQFGSVTIRGALGAEKEEGRLGGPARPTQP